MLDVDVDVEESAVLETDAYERVQFSGETRNILMICLPSFIDS